VAAYASDPEGLRATLTLLYASTGALACAPVCQHRRRGCEQGGPDGDQGDLPARHPAQGGTAAL
jgi:hypothetical protein